MQQRVPFAPRGPVRTPFRGPRVPFNQASQYSNLPYRGPAPMVLGGVQQQQQQTRVCFHCGKPGHLRKDCFALKRDIRLGKQQAGGSKGPQQLNNVQFDVPVQQ